MGNPPLFMPPAFITYFPRLHFLSIFGIPQNFTLKAFKRLIARFLALGTRIDKRFNKPQRIGTLGARRF